MPSWRDNLRPASFRGVAFEVLDDETAFGRRKIIFEYPQRDEADSEDDGKRPRVFRVDAVVRPGADFMQRRDALMAAVEDDPAPGTLIHPYFGQHLVEVTDCSVRHSSTEGGWCRFSIEFTKVADRQALLATRPDTTYLATAAADDLSDQAQSDLGAGLVTSGQPSFVLDHAHELIAKAQDAVTNAGKTLAGYGAPLNAFIAQGLSLRADVVGLAAAPLKLSAALSSLIGGLSRIAATPADALGVLSGLLGFGNDLPPIDAVTPARGQQLANQQAVTQAVQRLAAAEAVRTVTNMTFTSYQDAVAARDTLSDGMLALSNAAADLFQDEAYDALNSARLAMVRDITARGGSLLQLYTYTPAADVPALVLARRLYDDVTRLDDLAADIVARNAIADAGMIAGGTALEVLSDVG